MSTIRECSDTFRTRNAGAFILTFDIVFKTRELYLAWRDSGIINADEIARRYKMDPAKVDIIDYPPANAIKISIPRRPSAGSPTDADLDSAAQFVPLLDLELPGVQG